MKISQRGIDLIIKWEGFKDRAYLCSANVWTIGFGSTRWLNGDPVKQGETITKKLAEQLLITDISRFSEQVRRLVNVPLTQPQFDALVSFTYNLGGGALERSTLLKKLNQGDYKGAAKEFERWVKAGGKRVQGLVNRRADERRMFEEYASVMRLASCDFQEPLRNRDLPLPTTMQEYGEPDTKATTTQKVTVATGGAAGAVAVAEAVQENSFLVTSVLEGDVKYIAIGVVLACVIGLIIWKWKR